ncbi:hypothetical protein [Streptomyces sp. NPDC057382]|uniref:hypothetical protein n=1 Tax=unclassified Streptomyces TaxID=2593676 RepID=UPI0036260A71
MTRIEWRPIKTTHLISSRPRPLSVTVAAVSVALIAVIALAVRDDDSGAGGATPGADATSAQPAMGTHTREGAAKAAEQIDAAFGSEAMYNPQSRREIFERYVDPASRDRMLADFTNAHKRVGERIGLDDQGRPPAGADLIVSSTQSRVTVKRYTGDEAKVTVWGASVFGLIGKNVKEIPPKTDWSTATVYLRWQPWGAWQATDWQVD